MSKTPTPTIRPQDDFYHYVNDSWLNANPIPPTESRWGIFSMLRDTTWQAMRAIYEELQDKTYPDGSIEQQARDLYFSVMHKDDLQVENRRALDEQLRLVDQITDRSSLSKCIGRLHRIGIDGPWAISIDVDDKDSKIGMFRFHQRVLTLPGREYYLEDSKKMRSMRAEYVKHIDLVQTHFEVVQQYDNFGATILELERTLAEHARPKADLRDPETNYHKVTYAELQKTYQNIDWPAYAAALQWKTDDKISVDQPEFLAFVNEQLTTLPLATWKAYLQWKLLVAYYGSISEAFAELRFEFFGKTLGGTPEILPLWKRAVLFVENAVGPGVGRLYAERHFPESSKRRVLDMVEEVRETYRQRIDRLDWMKPETKVLAQKKLANIKVLIGYPDEWRDFTKLKIGRTSLVANAMAAEAYDTDYYLMKLHQPTSRDDWGMNPQTVNAYNDSNRLVICFPAAILQAPFFDPKASEAANFGGIGTVIGHELSHGFDDSGYQFDDQGNLRPWQSAAERNAFTKKAQIIVDQADQFEVLPGLCLNGKLVLGESIADLGGIEIALDAYRTHLGKDIPQSDLVEFFTNYAKSECEATREEQMRIFTLTDPHPDGLFRINGILAHVDAFYDTFDIKPTDKLYRDPTTRAHIW